MALATQRALHPTDHVQRPGCQPWVDSGWGIGAHRCQGSKRISVVMELRNGIPRQSCPTARCSARRPSAAMVLTFRVRPSPSLDRQSCVRLYAWTLARRVVCPSPTVSPCYLAKTIAVAAVSTAAIGTSSSPNRGCSSECPQRVESGHGFVRGLRPKRGLLKQACRPLRHACVSQFGRATARWAPL